MAEQWGGKRTPRNPAPVSGPGQMSRRTDGGPQQVQAEMTGMPYGENAEFNTLQSSAPMSASPAMRPSRGGRASAPVRSTSAPTPLFAPTQRPDEPITAGAPFGPGDGPVMPTPQAPMTYQVSSTLSKVAQYSKDSTLSRMAELFARRGM